MYSKTSSLLIAILIFLNFSAFAQITQNGKIYKGDPSKASYTIQNEGIIYKSAQGIDMTLDILKSSNAELSPVVIYVHGGNWNMNNSSEVHRPYIESMLNKIIEMGYKVVSINYRLASELSPVNFAIEDTKDAVRWIKKNASEYDLDTTKIVLWGTSAGAHISQFAAYSQDSCFGGDPSLSKYSSSVNGLIDCYGPSDVLSVFKYKTGISTTIARWFIPSLYKRFLSISKDFSGINHKEDKKGLRKFMKKYTTFSIQNPRNVPTLILHGTSDEIVGISNSKKLKKYLDTYGIENTLKEYRKVKHSFERIDDIQLLNILYSTENFLNNIK